VKESSNVQSEPPEIQTKPTRKKKVGEKCQTELKSDGYRVLLDPAYYRNNLQLIENEEEPLVKAIVTFAHCKPFID
jgi:hypothetical protein